MASARDIRAGGAFVELNTKNSAFLRGLDQAARKFQAFGMSVAKVGLAITGTMAGITAAVVGVATPLAHFSDTYLNILNRVSATNDEAAKSTAVLTETVDALFAIADRARVPIEGLVELYSRLSLSAKDAGLDQQKLLSIVETVSKAAAIGGGSQQSVDAAMVQLGQILGSGGAARGIGQELNSIREQTPALFRVMAEGLGRIGVTANGTGEEMRKLAEEGKLSSKQIAAAILAMGKDVDETFFRIAPTISGAFTVVRNRVIKTLGELSQKTGFGDAFAKAVFRLADAITSLGDRIAPVLVRISEWAKANQGLIVTIVKIGAAVAIGGAVLVAFGTAVAGVGFILSGVGAAITAISATVAAMLSPVALITAAIVGAGAAFLYLTDTGAYLRDQLASIFEKIVGGIKVILSSTGTLSDAWSMAMDEIVSAAAGIWEDIKLIWNQITSWLDGVFRSIGENFVRWQIIAMAKVQEVWAKGVNFFKRLTANLGDELARSGFVQKLENLRDRRERVAKSDLSPEEKKAQLAQIDKDITSTQFEIDYIDANRKKWMDQIDDETAEKLKAIEDRKNAELAAVDQMALADEQARQAKMAAIQAEHDAAVKAIEEDRDKKRADRQEELKKSGLPSLMDQLDKLRAELADMTGGDGTKPLFDRKAIDEFLASVGVGAGKDGADARGTFNAAAIQSLQSGVQDRIAKATEQTAKNTKKTADKPDPSFAA